MSRLLCICGEHLSDTSVPTPTKLWLTTDQKLDNAYCNYQDSETYLREKDLDFLEVWACPTCGAIGIEIEHVFNWFKPTDPGFRLLEVLKK